MHIRRKIKAMPWQRRSLIYSKSRFNGEPPVLSGSGARHPARSRIVRLNLFNLVRNQAS
jgi:hypothetical protein